MDHPGLSGKRRLETCRILHRPIAHIRDPQCIKGSDGYYSIVGTPMLHGSIPYARGINDGIEGYSIFQIGIAVADKPLGPYKESTDKPLLCSCRG
jgi:hypothetical protein